MLPFLIWHQYRRAAEQLATFRAQTQTWCSRLVTVDTVVLAGASAACEPVAAVLIRNQEKSRMLVLAKAVVTAIRAACERRAPAPLLLRTINAVFGRCGLPRSLLTAVSGGDAPYAAPILTWPRRYGISSASEGTRIIKQLESSHMATGQHALLTMHAGCSLAANTTFIWGTRQWSRNTNVPSSALQRSNATQAELHPGRTLDIRFAGSRSRAVSASRRAARPAVHSCRRAATSSRSRTSWSKCSSRYKSRIRCCWSPRVTVFTRKCMIAFASNMQRQLGCETLQLGSKISPAAPDGPPGSALASA